MSPSRASRYIASLLVVSLGFFNLSATIAEQSCVEASQSGADHRAVVKICLPLAEAGDPYSMALMGVAYSEGRGVKESPARSLAWTAQALSAYRALGGFEHVEESAQRSIDILTEEIEAKMNFQGRCYQHLQEINAILDDAMDALQACNASGR